VVGNNPGKVDVIKVARHGSGMIRNTGDVEILGRTSVGDARHGLTGLTERLSYGSSSWRRSEL